MFNAITKNFSSLWALISAPFKKVWKSISFLFPERDVTMMDTPRGNVYSYHQTSFWRFTKFCLTVGFSFWAAWSTYIYVYHRPLLQKRTQQLEEIKELHAHQMVDITSYMKKFTALAHSLNVIDDKILNSKKLSENDKEILMKQRLTTWGELDFLQTRLLNNFISDDYNPEFQKLSDMYVEYDVIREENKNLRTANTNILSAMENIADADMQIVDTVSKLTTDNVDELHKKIKKIGGTLSGIGLSEKTLINKANKFSSPLVGSAFNPLNMDKILDSKYQRLADNLELWSGLSRLNTILPLGAPVASPRITSSFGVRSDPFTGENKKHKGLDFAGKIGTPLYVIAPGRVISSGDRFGYGNAVEIDHGLGFSTLYAHLSKINVKRGDWLRPGDIVGLAGSSGRSTGPHLHYEIRYKSSQFDPINFVKE